MKKNLIITAIATYCLIGIATYGNAAVYFERQGIKEANACEISGRKYCYTYQSTGIAATFSTLLWPYYWSYRIAKGDA